MSLRPVTLRRRRDALATTTMPPLTMMMMMMMMLLLLGSPTVSAFMAHTTTTTTTTTRATRRLLLATTKKNEWGIPPPDDLPILSDTILPVLPNGGHISLIGAGPGDPELLTLKAARLLQDPQALVVADRLVSDEILQLVRGEIKVARKWPGCQHLAQDEIYAWCHEGLAAGKHVIRLKIGDPFVFGRGGEEVLQFRRFGVQAAVVPVRVVSSKLTIQTTMVLSCFFSLVFP